MTTFILVMPIPTYKFPSVIDELKAFDIMSFPVYRCKQLFSMMVTGEIYCMCPAEFSSERFNLGTSRVFPNVNVRIDKCINLYVRVGTIKIKVCAENHHTFNLYDRVRCVIYNTCVGVIYKFDSVAFLSNADIDRSRMIGREYVQ